MPLENIIKSYHIGRQLIRLHDKKIFYVIACKDVLNRSGYYTNPLIDQFIIQSDDGELDRVKLNSYLEIETAKVTFFQILLNRIKTYKWIT